MNPGLTIYRYVLRIPLRYSDEQLLIGDEEVHGELPYAFFHQGKHDYDAEFGRNTGVIAGVNPESSTGVGNKLSSSEEDVRKGAKQA